MAYLIRSHEQHSPRFLWWRRWLFITAILLVTHLATARSYWNRYAENIVVAGGKTLTLDLSQDDWATATMGADSSAYLRVAKRVAAGQGITVDVPGANPPRVEPFYYWGPGAPAGLGTWLALVGGDTMRTFFWFAVVSQLFFGVVAVATIRLYTHNLWALALTAFLSGFCPPLQAWFYGINLTSSEIVAVVPLSLMIFALSKAFLSFRAATIRVAGQSFSWASIGWFTAVGLLIGVYSLIRDSGAMFATFLAVFVVGRAALADRRRLALALSIGLAVTAGVFAVRQPVRSWNKQRLGHSMVCSSSDGSIWRYGLWFKHDQYDWYQAAGIGFGEYLNPEGAKRVEDYYLACKPRPELYSFCTLMEGVVERPDDALAFKASRLPVLWLGADPWPNVHLTLVSWWCVALYSSLLALVGVHWWRRRYVPEPMYLYLLLIVAASPLIHYEFRYTFPIWQTLILAPGMLLAALTKNGRREQETSDAGEAPAAIESPIARESIAA